VTNRDIDFNEDMDFKKTSKYWVGRNIGSISNFENKDKKIKKGTTIFVCTEDNNKGYEFVENSNGWEFRNVVREIHSWRHEVITLGVDNGSVDIIPFDESEFKGKEIKEIKNSRIWDSVYRKKEVVFFREYEILHFDEKNPDMVKITGINPETREESKVFHIRDIIKEKITKEDGTEFNGLMID